MLTYFNFFSLSFVLIAQNKFQTQTYADKPRAAEHFRTMFWGHVNELKDDQGYVTSEGLRVRYINTTVRMVYLKINLDLVF
jgi:hypothetical protein